MPSSRILGQCEHANYEMLFIKSGSSAETKCLLGELLVGGVTLLDVIRSYELLYILPILYYIPVSPSRLAR